MKFRAPAVLGNGQNGRSFTATESNRLDGIVFVGEGLPGLWIGDRGREPPRLSHLARRDVSGERQRSADRLPAEAEEPPRLVLTVEEPRQVDRPRRLDCPELVALEFRPLSPDIEEVTRVEIVVAAQRIDRAVQVVVSCSWSPG